MSNKKTAKTLPTHRIYAVSRNGEQNATWAEIGAAWPHKDGKGFDILYEVVPLNGRITLRTNEDKK